MCFCCCLDVMLKKLCGRGTYRYLHRSLYPFFRLHIEGHHMVVDGSQQELSSRQSRQEQGLGCFPALSPLSRTNEDANVANESSGMI